MIFGPRNVRLIHAGQKTMTRRPVKCDAAGDAQPCRYKVGRDYSVQEKYKGRGVSRIVVTNVREELWNAISADDARREGFDTPAEFFDYVRGLYGDDFDLEQRCHVISFVQEGAAA